MKFLAPWFFGMFSVMGLLLLLDSNRVYAERVYLPRHLRQSWGNTAIEPWINLYPTMTADPLPDDVQIIPSPPPLSKIDYIFAVIFATLGLGASYSLLLVFTVIDVLIFFHWLRKKGYVSNL